MQAADILMLDISKVSGFADYFVIMSADSLTYDEARGIVTATGNVEISQGHRLLIADTVTYNEGQDMMTASGGVTLLEPSGEVLFADYMELSDEMRDGVMRNIRLLLNAETRIAANEARRSGGNRTGTTFKRK